MIGEKIITVSVISARLAIDGEAAYKQAISTVNAELKNMQSTLKLVESEYKGNTNSIAPKRCFCKAYGALGFRGNFRLYGCLRVKRIRCMILEKQNKKQDGRVVYAHHA